MPFFFNLNPSKVLNCICKKGEIKTSPTTKTCHWYQGGQAGENVLSSYWYSPGTLIRTFVPIVLRTPRTPCW